MHQQTAIPDWSRQPSWSPDGTQIVYTAHSRLTDAQQIWVMSFSGHGQTLLVPRGPYYWDFLPRLVAGWENHTVQ